MNTCVNHAGVPATAFCRSCGKALCEACQTKLHGTIYCEEHRPIMDTPINPTAANAAPPIIDPYGSPYQPPVYAQQLPVMDPSISPGLARCLSYSAGF